MKPFSPLNLIGCLLTLTAYCAKGQTSSATSRNNFTPGVVWNDTRGNRINAHGGGVIWHDGRYYWFGEHKLLGHSEAHKAGGGVHCYSSTNLYDWEDEGLALSVNYTNKQSDIAAGCILERPKVVFNAGTRTFVMFFKLYLVGTEYETGYVGVATATNAVGPYLYRHKFLGGASPKGTGDFALVLGGDGAMYHLAVRKPDKAFCAGRLQSDYLFPEGDYQAVEGITHHTEAPAVVRTAVGYYLLGSGSTGWKPNAARAFLATNLTGPYTSVGNPLSGVNPHNGLGPEATFGSQSSFIVSVTGKTNAYIAMFDQWQPEAPINGGYIWLPLTFDDSKPAIQWRDAWALSLFDGK